MIEPPNNNKMLFTSYFDLIEAIVLNNEITPQISHEVKKEKLLPYLLEVLPSITTEELCSRNFHIRIMRSLELKNIIGRDRHLHKRFEGVILFAMIALFISRLEGHAYQTQFTLVRLTAEFPEIVNDAKCHLSSKFSLNHLVSVWETFYVAIHLMHIRPSGKKSALLLAANLFADPVNAMTMGGRQVMRTTLALKIFDLVSGTTVIRRTKRKVGYDTTDSEASDSDYDNNHRGRKRSLVKPAPRGATRRRIAEHAIMNDDILSVAGIYDDVLWNRRFQFDPSLFDDQHGPVLTMVDIETIW